MTIQSVPPKESLSPRARILGIFLFTLLPALLAAALVLVSPAPVVQTVEGQAKIHFSADRRSVFLAGECVTARWQVEGIREVYINDQPTVGSDSSAVCMTPEMMPVLKVVLRDGTTREYRLDIAIVSRNPIFWVLVGLSALFLLASLAWLLAPAFTPRLRSIWPSIRKATTIVEVLLVGLLVMSLVLEFGLRFYFTNFGTEHERIRYLYSAADIAAKPSSLLPLPYVSYAPSPAFIGHNSLGYRGPEIQVPKPQGTFRIVALGGSTTYSTSTPADQSYPAQLQQLLHDEYGYANVEVVNAGVAGYTSWDTFVNYALRVVELQPDMLIIYDGINDIQPRMANPDCYRGDNPLRGLNPNRGLWQSVRIESSSTLYRLVAIHFGWMADPSTLTSAFNYFPITCSFENVNIKNNLPIYFERNLRAIIAVAQANSTQVMVSTWTHDPKTDLNTIPPQWQAAVVEHNAVLRMLAGEYNLPLYDLAATDFATNALHWSDPIHMSTDGTHEQARRYAAFIKQHRLIP